MFYDLHLAFNYSLFGENRLMCLLFAIAELQRKTIISGNFCFFFFVFLSYHHTRLNG